MKKAVNQRKIQAEATKKTILETARQMFAQHGVKNVSIRQICRRIGITNGAFYHHFQSKDDIVLRLCMSDLGDYLVERLAYEEEAFDPLHIRFRCFTGHGSHL
jgi:AcrR family transcriptional regulator